VVEPKPILLVFCLAGVPACADVDEPIPVDAARDSATAALDGGGSSALGCTLTRTVDLASQPADVLLLLDRSGSMDMAFGAGTRYQAVARVLAELVSSHAQHVRFGYQEFPGRQACEGQASLACCASPPTVGVAPDHAAAVVAALASAVPMEGSTPTPAALHAAYQYYDGLYDGIENRYVLLATDGEPDCTLAGAWSSGAGLEGSGCTDAMAEVAALVSAGVRVMVLGVGTESGAGSSAAACLDGLAHAGGAAASPGSPGYYAASDSQGLSIAIEQVFGGLTRPSCSFRLGSNITDRRLVVLSIDGQQIPRTSPDGWRLPDEGPPVLRVTGTYCEAIQTFQVHTIMAQYACRPCVDLLECQ
jgi:Mg-chelatase subunit ChlD